MKVWKYIIAASFALMFILPSAQAQTSLVSELDPVKFLFAPDVPAPREKVRIEVQGVGSFLGNATITWRLNGSVALTGKGERAFTFTSGDLGVQSRVDVTIVSTEKGTITKSFVFTPSVVNLIWEADTSTPPLFKGKSFYSAGSTVTVNAFPTIVANGRTISSNNFSFQWSRNGSVLTQQSGLGRSSFTFNGDQLLKRELVGVEVYLENVLVGKASVSIPVTNPVLVLYRRDPLLGVHYDRAVTSPFTLTSTETTLFAQPYYFSNNSIANNALAFTWNINNKEVTGPSTADGVITLRQTGPGSGQSNLGVKLQNMDERRFLQAAQTAIRVVFGEKSNSILPSLFGL